MLFPIVYDGATFAAKGPQPGAQALMAWALDRWPTSTNLGIYNPRTVRGGTSLSIHAEGRAADVGFPYRVGGTAEGWDCAETVKRIARDVGVQQIIYSRKLWRNTRAERGWVAYAGVAPHHEHVHIELTRAAGRSLTRAMLDQAVGTPGPAPTPAPTPTTQGDDSMLLDFIRMSYAAAGQNPDADPKGVAYWFHTAAAEHPGTHWTYQMCRQSNALAYMVKLLAG